MQEQALNYCTQAIESLTEQSRNFEFDSPMTAQNIRKVAALLQESVKFYLPDNGRLFDDGLRALPAVFRLPYPIIAGEFRIVGKAPAAHQPLANSGVEIEDCTKRIALAIEINEANVDQFSWLVGRNRSHLYLGDGAIAIIPVFYSDIDACWKIPPFGSVFSCHKSHANPDAIAMTNSVYGDKIPKGMTRIPITTYRTFLMPESCAELEIHNGQEHTMAMMAQDTNDEFVAVMELIEILSCKNVSTDTLAAPQALNKKRAGKGKPPFFEYKVLMLDHLGESKESTGAPRGTHASPRVHLRRGHIRRLTERNVWVNAAVVGNKQAGMVMKDYAVKTPSK